MTERKLRVAVVNSHPVQYFAPLYAYLNARSEIDLDVLYLSNSSIRGEKDKGFGHSVAWDVDLLAGYSCRFVGRNFDTATPAGFFSLIAPEIWTVIRNGGYDAVLVHGHGYAANLIAIVAAKIAGAGVLMRCETHPRLPCAGFKATLRKPLLSLIYRLCDRFLAIGSANRDFYRMMGAPDAKISLVPYAVDNERFIRESRIDAQERKALRAEMGVDDETPIVIYASKFQRRKHPDTVVRAIRLLEEEGIDVALSMVGAGDMEHELKAAVASAGLRRCSFTGFVNQSRLPKYLGACDVFVLAAREEPWGLIVNEAMCAGLPVVVGDEIGCVDDLVRNGDNGFTVPAGDALALATALRPIVTDPQMRRAMSLRSSEIIATWSYAECLRGWRDALREIRRPPTPFSALEISGKEGRP